MPKTIQQLITAASEQLCNQSESALLDAEVLLAHCLSKNRSYLRAWPDRVPSEQQTQQFLALLVQREQGQPIAYLTGHREFWSRNFRVTADVLIPRPDSELLIELSLARLDSTRPCRIVDLGTGSGILAITLAAELPLAEVLACDISESALNIANTNAEQLNVRVQFLNSHWLEQVPGLFDLIVSNPPYIADDDPHLQQGDVRFEPDSALVSTENGLRDLRLIAEQAREHLNPGGWLMVEHGYQQAEQTQTLFAALNYQQIQTHHDLANNPRVTSGIWNPS